MTTDKLRKTLVRARMASTGRPYVVAARDVEIITEVAAAQDCDYAEAEAEYDDPHNQLLCADCGWTVGMICPECEKGCGCEYRCSGWRHKEWNEPDDDPMADDQLDPYVCAGCGAWHEQSCTC